MITSSITHVLQSILQYIALIATLLLYRWIKDAFPLSNAPYTTKRFDRYLHILNNHRTRSWIRDKPPILYQWIKQLRQKHSLTQEELAEKIGVDPRTVQRWESGTQPQPRHYEMFQLLEQDWSDRQDQPDRFTTRHISERNNLHLLKPPVRKKRTLFWLLSPLLIISVALFVFLLLRFWFHLI